MIEAPASPVVIADVRQAAAEAARILGVTNLIDETADTLFAQIEGCDAFATGSEGDSDSIFIALSLPIANALVHYGTSRHAMADARAWFLSHWPEANTPDPTSALAVLTLIYIVDKAVERYRDQPEKRDVWLRIQARMAKVSNPVSD